MFQLPKTKIILHGNLKRRFGSEFEIGASTTRDAFRTLLAAKPDFRKAISEGSWEIVRGDSKNKGIHLTLDLFDVNISSKELHIYPAARGAKNGGAGKAILGAVIVVAAVAAAPASGGGSLGLGATAFAGVSYGSIALFGAMMVFSGISQMMTKTPKSQQPSEGKKSDPSYLYDGAVNTVELGHPVKLVYGKIYAGSAVISATVTNYDIAIPGAVSSVDPQFPNDGSDPNNPVAFGAGGGKGSGSSSQTYTAKEADNTLRSRAVINIIDLIGEGPMRGPATGNLLSSTYLNGTPIKASDGTDNFPGINMDWRAGDAYQTPIGGFAEIGSTEAVGTVVKQSTPVIRQIGDSEFDAFTINLRFPALYQVNTSNGDMNPYNVHYQIHQFSETTGWQVVYDENLQGKCTSPYEKSIRLGKLGPNSVNSFRVVRVSPDNTLSSTASDLIFQSITKLKENRYGYHDSCIVALSANAELFSSIPERAYYWHGAQIQVPFNYDPVARNYATSGTGTSGGIWDHATFKTVWTDNPAWIYLDLLTNSRYGIGGLLPWQHINLAAIYQIAQYCDEMIPDGFGSGGMEPRFSLNCEISTRAEALSYLQSISSVFRGMTYYGFGAITATADMPKLPVKRINNTDVINGEFKYSGSPLSSRHSVAIVKYNDMNDMGRLTPERVEDIDAIEQFGLREIEVSAFGCSSRAQAIRLGNWILDSEKTQTEAVVYQTTLSHADVTPGDIIEIADEYLAGIRTGGKVVNIVGRNITLDADFEVEYGKTYQIGLVTEEGDAAAWVQLGYLDPGKYRTVQALTMPTGVVKGRSYTIKSNTLAPRQFEVRSIREINDVNFEVTGLIYDPTKFARVELGIYIPPEQVSILPSRTQPLRPPTNITAYDYMRGVGTTSTVCVLVGITPSTDQRVRSYEFRAVNNGVVVRAQEVKEVSYEFVNLELGNYTFMCRALGPNGAASAWATSDNVVVDGTTAPPDPPTGLIAVGKTRAIRVQWALPNTRLFKSIQLWRSGSTFFNAGFLAAETSGRDYYDDKLGVSETWYYWVRTRDTLDQFSGWIGPVVATTTKLIADDIQDGILNTAKFAQGLKPVNIGSSFPIAAVDNDMFLNTSDGKIYYYSAAQGRWLPMISDLDAAVGQISETQIEPNSISTPKLQANSIQSGNILAGAVNSDKLAANSVIAGKIQAGAVRAAEIAVNEIRAVHLASETIITQAAQMGSAVINSASIQDLSVGTLKIANGSITTTTSAVRSDAHGSNQGALVVIQSDILVPEERSGFIIATYLMFYSGLDASHFADVTVNDGPSLAHAEGAGSHMYGTLVFGCSLNAGWNTIKLYWRGVGPVVLGTRSITAMMRAK